MDSNAVIPQSTPTSHGPDDLALAVGMLFRVFGRAFGSKWRATFEDPQAPLVWERKFSSIGMSAEMVRSGIGPATDLAFPPSLGEFIALCRAEAPHPDAALREAIRWQPDREFAWSHPAIGAAARDIGYHTLHAMKDRRLRPLFADVYRQMLVRFARGESLELPAVRALPAEVRVVPPRGEPTSPATAAAIAQAARACGVRNG